jgi:hypothetical protein
MMQWFDALSVLREEQLTFAPMFEDVLNSLVKRIILRKSGEFRSFDVLDSAGVLCGGILGVD